MKINKTFILSEIIIVTVYITCYWGLELGTALSLVACLPVAIISVYLLIQEAKTKANSENPDPSP